MELETNQAIVESLETQEEDKEKENRENEEAEKEAAKDLLPEWEAPIEKN
jgi:hypothetical protein